MEKYNLQARLGIILAVFFVIASVTTLVRAVITADKMVMEEIESVSELVNRMFSIAEMDNDSPFNPDSDPDFLQELIALDNLRHVDIQISSTLADYPQVNTSTRQTINAPGWFVNMVYPEMDAPIRVFTQSNGDINSILADPADEIEEVWSEARTRFLATFAFLAMLLGVIYFFIQRWLSPLENIHGVLDNVEHGDFSRRIPSFSLPEFRSIGDRINHLTTWLGASKSENERLTRKSITVQEHERRHLAQELHDSLGQAVSAIKAIAVSIGDRSTGKDQTTVDSAKNIEDIADSAYKSVRKLMTSLRPQVLDELGLTEALNQMVDDWNVHHEDTFCRLNIEGSYNNLHEEQQINLYRIIQEALTNISKYAQAENVSVTLSGSEIVTLLIMDDGVGFAMNEISQSMGLTGIRDRVTLLRGELEIASKPGKGVSIQIEFPRINHFRRRASHR